jgi:dTDP-glucose 4,6-dehydratase
VVVGVDNLSTGRQENLAHLRDNKAFEFIDHDVINPLEVSGAIDRIYHLASPCSTAAYVKRQIAMLKTNSQGTWNLLELAEKKGARFQMASSSEAYGDALTHPQREDYWGNVNPVGLRSMYDEGKRFAEACTMAYHRSHGVDTRIVRIFHTYGPRMDVLDGRVVINFIQEALANRPLCVYGDGRQTRSLCYVSDLVEGMQLAMESDFPEPINLGHPEEVSILKIANEIIELVPNCSSKINFQPMSPDDPRHRCPDITRAKQFLRWSPKVSRKEGLGKMIEFYSKVRSH